MATTSGVLPVASIDVS
jgi:DNA replication licensing factor MCM7